MVFNFSRSLNWKATHETFNNSFKFDPKNLSDYLAKSKIKVIMIDTSKKNTKKQRRFPIVNIEQIYLTKL